MSRWNLVISDETDKALRLFLAHSGGKKGDLSDFVEEAVRDKLFRLTVKRVKKRTAKTHPDALSALIAEAVAHARTPAPRS
jgi:hypothetical protein